jgi:hypothetical protein
MGIAVFANGMSIACKAASGKSIAAMPDVCLSPPSPPAGPIPLPYPNTAAASDTSDGSKTVQIGGQEVMLKNKSTFKTSSGNEAATKSFGMGVVTHQIQGKAAFLAWSMDVKFEGENVPRHMDIMGHNEASEPPNLPPWAYFDSMTPKESADCADLKEKVSDKCGKHIKNNTYSTGSVNRSGAMSDMCNEVDDGCRKASECMLVEYGGSGSPNCCPGKTGHHLIPAHCFMPPGARKAGGDPYEDWPKYDVDKAPTACVEGSTKELGHGELHEIFDLVEDKHLTTAGTAGAWPYSTARDTAASSLKQVNASCDEACTKAQLNAYHRKACKDGANLDSTPLRADSTGRRTPAGFKPSPSSTITGMQD